MPEPSEPEHVFEQSVRLSDDRLDLARAALQIATVFNIELRVDTYLRKLDQMAAPLREHVRDRHDPRARLRTLTEYCFEELGFRGNSADYEDPRNSYLNDVLDRRLGIPISLSIVLMEVGRRAGVQLDGVGFPGHFLIRWTGPNGERLFLDPFHRGRIVEAADLLAHARQSGVPESRAFQFLSSVTKRQILTRMLHNLKASFTQRGSLVDAHRAVGLLLVLSPWDLDERRDRGLLALALGRVHEAAPDLAAYLAHRPDAADAPMIRDRLARIQQAPFSDER